MDTSANHGPTKDDWFFSPAQERSINAMMNRPNFVIWTVLCDQPSIEEETWNFENWSDE